MTQQIVNNLFKFQKICIYLSNFMIVYNIENIFVMICSDYINFVGEKLRELCPHEQAYLSIWASFDK